MAGLLSGSEIQLSKLEPPPVAMMVSLTQMPPGEAVPAVRLMVTFNHFSTWLPSWRVMLALVRAMGLAPTGVVTATLTVPTTPPP